MTRVDGPRFVSHVDAVKKLLLGWWLGEPSELVAVVIRVIDIVDKTVAMSSVFDEAFWARTFCAMAKYFLSLENDGT
jgi:hypothetical protein